MEFLKKLWTWLLSQTTIDEQVEAKVTKITKEVSEVKAAAQNLTKEVEDVVGTVVPKKSGASPKITKSGASTEIKGSGTFTQITKSGASTEIKGSGTTTELE
jgi:hypothetical protein